MKKTIALATLAFVLSACGTPKTEMPDNQGVGTDLMRKSPCVCIQLDYDDRGYKWLG